MPGERWRICLLLCSLGALLSGQPGSAQPARQAAPAAEVVTLFLCGDVMTGRGIDQVLPHPSPPRIYEPYVTDARRYVDLAEAANGPIPRPADFAHTWGDALAELERVRPDARIVNLETSVTQSADYWQGKGINYRMNPRNVPCLAAAGIDVCCLANNHVLDWGYPGLAETLQALAAAGLKAAGAGLTRAQAEAPAVVELQGKGRVLVFSVGTESSGIPAAWAAADRRAGVWLLEDLSTAALRRIGQRVRGTKRAGDIAVASIHWGGNWGYDVPAVHRKLAHALIEEAGIDVVHGHSSHHVRPIELHRGKLILYGCGDFINDYEGIGGYERFRPDLALMYFARLDAATGELLDLRMTPLQRRRFRLQRACREDALWLADALSACSRAFGTRVEAEADGTLSLR